MFLPRTADSIFPYKGLIRCSNLPTPIAVISIFPYKGLIHSYGEIANRNFCLYFSL